MNSKNDKLKTTRSMQIGFIKKQIEFLLSKLDNVDIQLELIKKKKSMIKDEIENLGKEL